MGEFWFVFSYVCRLIFGLTRCAEDKSPLIFELYDGFGRAGVIVEFIAVIDSGCFHSDSDNHVVMISQSGFNAVENKGGEWNSIFI